MKVTLHVQGEKQMTKIVGVDVSKDRLDCMWLMDMENEKTRHRVFQNSPAGFQLLIKWLQKKIDEQLENIHVIVEATSVYHEGLIYALHGLGVKISVANPAYVRDFAKSHGVHNKTDKKDSMMLARYAATHPPKLRLWQPEPIAVRELKAMLSRLSALQKDIQREENRLEKAQIAAVSSEVIKSIKTMIKSLQRAYELLEKQINDHIDGNPTLKNDRELLQSIPGVGDVVSREMTAVIASRDFTKASEVSAFLGLVPKQKASGKKEWQTVLTKKCSGRVRATLYMAAVVASRYNPDIKAQYDRLRGAGKTKMQALCAGMRKLVQICFGVIKHQSKYQCQTA